jgi:phosphoribosylformimino-5-aminoimidazole carboxamide ribonucleotide (ProFAR) isomerase
LNITRDARTPERLGVAGIDLLAYQYELHPEPMIKGAQRAVKIPLVVAAGIESLERVRKMVDLRVWSFTVGSVFFDRKFAKENLDGANREW